MTNRLYYGDNLDVLREHVGTASIDLVYLDPPFNSNVNYNILFKSPAGAQADAQIEAFEDTWHWNEKAEDAFDQVARSGNTKAFDLLNAMGGFLGENDMMAYLAMISRYQACRAAYDRHHAGRPQRGKACSNLPRSNERDCHYLTSEL